MTQQFDFFRPSIDLFRSFSDAMLSGSQELIAAQLDSLQVSLTRGSKLVRTGLSEMDSLREPKQWSTAVQTGLRNSIEITRDAVLANSEGQMETLRLLQRQTAEGQQLLRDAFGESLAALQGAGRIS